MANPEKFYTTEVAFLGEQDGPPEREFKTRLNSLFRHEANLKTAYLVRIRYRSSDHDDVALCLRANAGQCPQLVKGVQRVFASMFGKHEHLDIMFLDEEKEMEVRSCCEPFFSDIGTPRQ